MSIRDARGDSAERRRAKGAWSFETEAIQAAFDRADYAAVRILLEVVVPASDIDRGRGDLILAQLARIDGDIDVWYVAADRAERVLVSFGERLHASALKACAARRGGAPHDDGTAAIAAVAEAAKRVDAITAGPATYLLAVEAWQAGDCARAERIIARNVEAGAYAYMSRALIGWIAVKRERFRDAGDHFEAALELLERSGATDERNRAKLVHAVANVAAETVDLERGARAKAAFERIRWTPALEIDHVVTLAPLRYLALLAGDLDEALFVARDAATRLRGGPYAVLSETGEAFVHDVLGDRGALRFGLRRAWQLAREIKWSAASRAERIALADFAMTAAPSMPAEARQAATIYRSLVATPDPSNELDDDRRVRAFELMASGCIDEVLGDGAAALRDYEAALTAWRELSYDLRVAQVAARLFALTRDDGYARIGRAALRTAPRAWLHAALQGTEDPVADLRPSERRVLEGLLRGESAKHIAAALGRSPHTISNHTRKIFRAFAVTSRSRLVARCVELGLTSGSVASAPSPRRRSTEPSETVASPEGSERRPGHRR